MSEPLNLLLIGRVVHRLTGEGLPGLQIQAMVHPTVEPAEEVGSTESTADGGFQMEVEDEVVRSLLQTGGGLSIRVSDSTTLLLATSPDAWKPSMAGVLLTLRVGDPKVGEVEEAQTPRVYGVVRKEDGHGLAGVLVRLRQHTNLGVDATDLAAGMTDSEGAFSLRYRSPAPDANGTPPLLRLVVEQGANQVAASSLLKAPPSTLRVEVTVPGVSAHLPAPIAKLEASIAPFLAGHTLSALSKVEVGVIASEAKVSPVLLQKAVEAERLVEKFEAQSLTLERPIIQALLNQGLPADGLGLALSNAATIQSAWGQAVKDGDLASNAAPEISAFLEKAMAIGAEQAIGTEEAPTALRKALPAALDDAQRLAVAEAWISNTRSGDPATMWTSLSSNPAFGDPPDATLINQVKFSFQLGDLTDWKDPVVSKLRGAVSDAPALAGRTQAWWSAQLTDLHSVTPAEGWLPPGSGSIAERIEGYAHELRRKVDQAQPREQVKRYVAESASVSEEVKDFFDDEAFEAFDVRFDQVDAFLATHDPGSTVSPAAREEIKKIQKTAQVTQDHKVIDLLEEAEVGSVADLAKMPEEEFERRVLALAASPEVAVATNDARYASAAEDLLESYVRLAGGSTSGPMPMFDQVPVQVQTLFGSLGGCACEACLSALSPSAYLVELAAYLRDGFIAGGTWSSVWQKITQPVPGIPNPLDRRRREDLLLTPLTCAATQTPQPHIDLVNELLERNVPLLGGWGPAEIYRKIETSPVDPALDPIGTANLPPPLPLRPDASAEELAAYPLDTWYPALRVLARGEVRTSFTHPFDRPTVESRLYLGDVGTSLHQLLQLPVAATESRIPTDLGALRLSAIERLGMPHAEAQMFEQPAPMHATGNGADAWRFGPAGDGRFGEDLGPAEVSSVRVKGLLERLRLSWEQLVRVVGTRYVQRFSAASMPPLPVTCDVSGLVVVPGLAEPSHGSDPVTALDQRAWFLEGLHRFLRLQRRLGWEPEVLDAALALFAPLEVDAPARRTLDDAAWWAFAETQDLARALRLKPVELLALWSTVPSDDSTSAVFVMPLPEGSLWEQVFEKGPVRQPSDALFAELRTHGAVLEAEAPRALTELEQRALARALGLRLPDLLALRPVAEGPLVADRGQIWKLWARARVARSMGLPIAEAVWWFSVLAPPGSAMSPIGEGGWLRMQEFLRMVAFARTARVPHADVAYLLMHETPTRSRLYLSDVRAHATVTTLRSGLKTVVAETAPFRVAASADLLAEAAWVSSLARFTTHEAASRVFALLDAEESLSSETDTREGFLREVLGRVLWDHELASLIAIPVDEDASVARRQFVAQRLVRLSSLPDLPVPAGQGPRAKNGPLAASATSLVRRTLNAAVSPSATPPEVETYREGVEAFLGRLAAFGAPGELSATDDVVVCAQAFGAGFFEDLAAMSHATAEEIDARFDTVVRMCLLRERLLALPRLDEGGVGMQPASVLAALHVNDTFSAPLQTAAVAGLSAFLTSSFWAVVAGMSASTFAERELRREYLLVALDGLRAELEPGQRDAVRRSLQALSEEVWGAPLPSGAAGLASRFAAGLQPSDSAALASVFGAGQLVALSVEAAESVNTEWSVEPTSFADRRNRGYAWLLRGALLFRDRLRDFGLERQLTQLLADGLNVSVDRCKQLLRTPGLGVVDAVDAPTLAQAFFLSPTFIFATEPVPMPPTTQRLERLWKAARACEALRLTDDEVAQYNSGADLGLLELRELPVGAGMSEEDRSAVAWRLLDTWEALSFRALIRAHEGTVFDLIAAIAPSDGSSEEDRATIAGITGWAHLQPPTDSDELFDRPYTAVSYVAVSRRVRRRMAIEAVATALDVAPATALAWGVEFASTVTDSFTHRLAVTQGIRQSLRSRFGDAAWRTRSKPLIDQLREMQRDALADFHCQRQGFLDRNALFGWLLIDTEMSCCMQTTRVLFATAAVQTAIQRSLMGLEEGASPRPGYARRWEWMKQYRVWEANRKVFLYPENWLDPSLRRDKTHLFVELENSLLQSDLSEPQLTSAIASYLRGLDRISRPDVRAFTYEGDGPAEQRTLHVVARSPSAPSEYFYRKRIQGVRWTSWQKIDVQLSGDAHVLRVLDGHLHLFWAEVEKASGGATANGTSGQQTPPQQTGPVANSSVMVRIAYSRLENGKWSSARRSEHAQQIEWNWSNDWPSNAITNMLMGAEWSNARERLGHNVIIRVLPASDMSIAALISVYHSLAYAPAVGDVGVGSSLRGAFALRRCTGEVECITQESFPRTRTWSDYRDAGFPNIFHVPLWFGEGPPPSDLSSPFSPHYGGLPCLNGDQLEVRSDSNVAVALLLSESPSPTRVMVIPSSGAYGSSGLRRSPYVYRMTVEQSRTDEDADGVASYLRPARSATLSDGYRVFLFEVRDCTSCDSPADDKLGDVGSKLGKHISAQNESSKGSSAFVGANVGDALSFSGEESPEVVADFSAKSNSPPISTLSYVPLPSILLRVSSLHHAGACSFLSALELGGVENLYKLATQFPVRLSLNSDNILRPDNLKDAYDFRIPDEFIPSDDLDFGVGSAFGIYNWEVFFHIPFRVACKLNEDHQFERAQRWFHFIFDPFAVEMTVPSNLEHPELGGAGSLRRCWRFRPFFLSETGATSEDLQALVNPRDHSASALRVRQRVATELAVWLENPFDPHAIASARQRAFQMAVVFRYIDNLLDWGDQLFSRDTRESVNEATQIYILAAELLGARPMTHRRPTETVPLLLQAALGEPSTQVHLGNPKANCCGPRLPAAETLAALGRWKNFCIPPNDQLGSYWDRVADRLFKIRHCLNIDGLRRDLPLFEPPIDPALILRALAAGVDIGAALSDRAPALPLFRFATIFQRAVDFNNDVRNLGGQLLATWEKHDAEGLAQLRAGHERALLEAMIGIRDHQIVEASHQISALRESRRLAENRKTYFSSKTIDNEEERSAHHWQGVALGLQLGSAASSAAASILRKVPDMSVRVGFSPAFYTTAGGGLLSNVAALAGQVSSALASWASYEASVSATKGAHRHRYEDWMFQAQQSAVEITQIDAQIQAAQIREQIARHERDNLRRQIDNARAVEDALRSKFTNVELYDWMARQVSTILSQSYQMALDLARRAERAYRFERLDDSARFITADAWDSRQRGLLAGERLHLQLRRMEKAYLESERREYELTRHISLIQLNPVALLQLRENGECEFDLPETFFDRDHPGHYHRRIKSVSVSIPAVIGPYGGVHARLTLLSSVIRRRAELGDDSSEAGLSPEGRLIVRDIVPAQSIVTSSGQSDSGMFQLDFRSEKVLPFEGAGAVGRWRLEIDPQAQSFDTRTMTDVILHLQYTARDGGSVFAGRVREALLETEIESGRSYMVSLAQSAPDALHAFRTATDVERRALVLPALRSLIGYLPRGVRAEFRTFRGFFAMRAPNAAVTEGITVGLFHELSEADGLTLEPNALLVDSLHNMRLAPGAAFEFNDEEDVSPFQDDPAPVLVIDGSLGSEPLDALLDVILLLQVSLVREH